VIEEKQSHRSARGLSISLIVSLPCNLNLGAVISLVFLDDPPEAGERTKEHSVD
jgi:hypothetical protein